MALAIWVTCAGAARAALALTGRPARAATAIVRAVSPPRTCAGSPSNYSIDSRCPTFSLHSLCPQRYDPSCARSSVPATGRSFAPPLNRFRSSHAIHAFSVRRAFGFTAVLHTWGRALAYHPHLHVLVPAGGLSDDGASWITSRPDFLVPVKALSKIFRAKFRHELQRAGLLKDIAPAVWTENFVTDSRAVGDGESTLTYLSRYVFRVAISNARIVSCDDGRVRFRWKKSGSRRWRTMELDALEFIRRFLQHVLPRGLQKVRHYGFLSPQSAVSLHEVRVFVARVNPPADGAQIHSDANGARAAPSTTTDSPTEHPFCSCCGGRLHVIAIVFHRVGFRDSR